MPISIPSFFLPSPPPFTSYSHAIGNTVSPSLTLPAVLDRLSEHQRPEPSHLPVSRTENVTNIDIDNRSASLIRRFGALYAHGRAEAMAALDALPELRNSEELKSKLLFSVVVVSWTGAQIVSLWTCTLVTELEG